MRTEQSDDSSLEFPAPISIETIQDQILDQKTAILEFFLGEKQSYSFLITKNAFVLRTLPPRALIEDSLRAYFKVLSTPPKGEYPGFLAAKRIYRDLIHDFEDTISPAIEHIIIIPDGILYYLPFETLIRDDGEETSRPPYLIERFKISYAPSASSLALLLQRSREAGNSKLLLALGDPVYTVGKSRSSGHNKKFEEALREIYLDNGFEFSPLPFSKTEIKEISRFFPRAGVDIYLEEMAKEEVVKKLSLTDYRILHFACHGFLDEKAPLRSALVLTLDDGTEEDGFLQGREIYNLKLNADLVVLSACQTAKGKLENGEGVFGLPRVFFYAGARSTLSSLWKVNDRSTSDLMQEFYRYIANGDDKAQALRLAKMKMLSSKFSHPFYWAAFVLNGDYHTVFSR
jgi:CHAT domain-containing protein